MFVAVKKMPLVNAVLLSNSAPLFIPLVTWVWLKERIGGMVWMSLSVGFAGVILILKPGLALLSDPIALIAISAAIFSALALVSAICAAEMEDSDRSRMAVPGRHWIDDGGEPIADHPGL
jgi:drug/metabolite transporter (DMT)-like permease